MGAQHSTRARDVDEVIEPEIHGRSSRVPVESELVSLLRLLTEQHLYLKATISDESRQKRMCKVLKVLTHGDDHWLVVSDSIQAMSGNTKPPEAHVVLINLRHVAECSFDIDTKKYEEASTLLGLKK